MFSFTEKFLIYSGVESEIIQKGIARSPFAHGCKHKKNCSLKSIFHLETDNISHFFPRRYRGAITTVPNKHLQR